VRTVDVYDSVLDQWINCCSMEARRSTLGCAVLNNCIYAVGGFVSGFIFRFLVRFFDF